jgi:hypothetical protein
MGVFDEVLKQMNNSNLTPTSGYVILDKYITRIPRKEKKKIKKQFTRQA